MQATVNDIRLGFIDEGKGSPIVFVHGFPLSRGCWRPQIDILSSSYRCIAPDLRGFGTSESSPGEVGPVSMDRYADDLAGLIDALGTGPVILVGHSMGGYVALAFARRHPEVLRGLALVATRAGADSPEAAEGRRKTARVVQSSGIQSVIDGMTPKLVAEDNASESVLEAVRGFMEPASADGVVGALLGMADRPDSTPGLAEISVPTLVATGAEDAIISPSESESLAQAIPGARLRVIADAGHFVAFEKPEDFNRELEDWLTTVPVRRT